jgi:alanyl-tRNA synthetase
MIIHHLYTSPGHNYYGHHGKPAGSSPIEEHESIRLVAGRGIEGDRFFDWKDDYKGQITLIDLRVINDIRTHAGNPNLPASAFRRNVVIEGLDLNTCGGTHCRSTADLGMLCLLGTEPMRGGTRAFFVAGARVRRRLAAHEDRNLQLRGLLDTGDEKLSEVIALRLDREKELARAVRRLSEELADAEAATLCSEESSLLDTHWQGRDMAFLQRVGRSIAESAPDRRALLTSESEDGAIFLVVAGESSGVELEAEGPRIAEVLGGRGGGRGTIFQGKADSLANRDQALKILRDA